MKGIVIYDTSAYRIGISQCSGMLQRKPNVFHGEFDSFFCFCLASRLQGVSHIPKLILRLESLS